MLTRRCLVIQDRIVLLGVTSNGIVRIDGDEVSRLDLPHRDLTELLADPDGGAAALAAPVVDRVALADVSLRCPLGASSSIWGVGLNYHAKAAETGRGVPDTPILYVKPGPALAGPGAVVPIPAVPSDELDYEAEVALVVGAVLDCASPDEAWAAVAGITAANDLTARDVMRTTGNPGLAKGFTGFSPVGPTMRTADELTPDFDLGVRGYVNGELRQDGRTSDFIFGAADLLARVSQFTTLRPGDVVLTGTPPGTGQDRGEFLAAGDRLTVEVDGLLPLYNTLGG